MGRRRFIDRKNARHFYLMSRADDNDVTSESSNVLQEYVPSNLRSKITADKLVPFFQDQDHGTVAADPKEDHVGEAALYGIYYEDQNEYDYMQHLKDVGRAANAVLIEAPTKAIKSSNQNVSRIETSQNASDIEQNAQKLADEDGSAVAPPKVFEISEEIREIMEALDDDAYVGDCEEELAELLFDDGELNEPYSDAESDASRISDNKSKLEPHIPSNGDNRVARVLDQQFDEVMRQYEESEYEFSGDEEETNRKFSERLHDQAEYMDVGSEKPKNGFLMMDEIRDALKDEESKKAIISQMSLIEERVAEDDNLFSSDTEDSDVHWDCQTILSTYTNWENRPRIIGGRTSRVPRNMHDIVEEVNENDGALLSAADEEKPHFVTRPKFETPDERKARKALVRTLKKERRMDKKANKLAFKAEKLKFEQKIDARKLSFFKGRIVVAPDDRILISDRSGGLVPQDLQSLMPIIDLEGLMVTSFAIQEVYESTMIAVSCRTEDAHFLKVFSMADEGHSRLEFTQKIDDAIVSIHAFPEKIGFYIFCLGETYAWRQSLHAVFLNCANLPFVTAYASLTKKTPTSIATAEAFGLASGQLCVRIDTGSEEKLLYQHVVYPISSIAFHVRDLIHLDLLVCRTHQSPLIFRSLLKNSLFDSLIIKMDEKTDSVLTGIVHEDELFFGTSGETHFIDKHRVNAPVVKLALVDDCRRVMTETAPPQLLSAFFKPTNAKCTIYVGGFDEKVDRDILMAAFLPFGDIVEVNIPPDADPTSTSPHRGFGFVEFEEEDDAHAAIDNMHLSEIYGRIIKVNLARAAQFKVQAGRSRRAVWEDEDYVKEYIEKPNEGETAAKETKMDEDTSTPP